MHSWPSARMTSVSSNWNPEGAAGEKPNTTMQRKLGNTSTAWLYDVQRRFTQEGKHTQEQFLATEMLVLRKGQERGDETWAEENSDSSGREHKAGRSGSNPRCDLLPIFHTGDIKHTEKAEQKREMAAERAGMVWERKATNPAAWGVWWRRKRESGTLWLENNNCIICT